MRDAGRWWRRIPPLVWAVTALHVALLLAYTVLYPAYLGYDEPQHVDLVVALAAGDAWPAPGERVQSQGVIATSSPLYGLPDRPAIERPYESIEFPARGERLSIDAAGGNAPTSGFLPNQMSQHPPLWYLLGALAVEVTGAQDWPYDRFVAVLRLLNVALLAPLPLFAWAIARRVSGDDVVAVAAAVLTLGVPGLTRVGASAGNDALVALTFAAALLALTRVATGDVSVRTALAGGVSVALALLTKGFGLVLLPLLAAAYVVAGFRLRSLRVLTAALVAFSSTAVGAAWWVRNLLVHGAVQPSGYGAQASAVRGGVLRPQGADPPLGEFLVPFYEVTASRFWAGLGVPEPPTFGPLLTNGLVAVLVVGVVAALVLGVPRRRLVLVLLLLPAVLLLALVGVRDLQTYLTYDKQGVGIGVHGRYVYGGVAGLAVVVAVGYRRVLGRAASLLPLLAVMGVVAVQVRALQLVYDDVWGRSFDAVRYVSPWPPLVTVLPIALALVTVLVVVVMSTRFALFHRHFFCRTRAGFSSLSARHEGDPDGTAPDTGREARAG